MCDLLIPEAGAFYIMDRVYLDFARLCVLDQAGAFFVTRAKSDMDARRVYSATVDRASGVICDQVSLRSMGSTLPQLHSAFGRIRFKDAEAGKTLVFLTNNTALPALTIWALYKSRWQWNCSLKMALRAGHCTLNGSSSICERFWGTSENAVKIKIWIAVSVYVFVAIVKIGVAARFLALHASADSAVTAFEKMPLQQALI